MLRPLCCCGPDMTARNSQVYALSHPEESITVYSKAPANPPHCLADHTCIQNQVVVLIFLGPQSMSFSCNQGWHQYSRSSWAMSYHPPAPASPMTKIWVSQGAWIHFISQVLSFMPIMTCKLKLFISRINSNPVWIDKTAFIGSFGLPESGLVSVAEY